MADGGYYDNFGVVTALEYMIDILSDPSVDLGNRKIVLLQIRASEVDEQPKRDTGKGFKFSSVGPFIALMSVRSSTQITRNDLDVGLMRDAFSDAAIQSVTFELGSVGPLSWDLTQKQKSLIEDQWGSRSNPDQLECLKSLFVEGAAQNDNLQICAE